MSGYSYNLIAIATYLLGIHLLTRIIAEMLLVGFWVRVTGLGPQSNYFTYVYIDARYGTVQRQLDHTHTGCRLKKCW